MLALTKRPEKTNSGTRITPFSLARDKPVRNTMIGLTTALLVAAVMSAYATAEDPIPQPTVLDSRIQPTVLDPIPQPDESAITLAEAIDISLTNNPDLMAARYDVDAANAQRDIAFGARLPELHLAGAYASFREPRLIQPRRPGTFEVLGFTDELLAGHFVLTVPLCTGGRLKNHVISAELITQARCQHLLHSRTELVFNVSSVFYSMLGQEKVINSLIFSQKALLQHHEKAKELFKAQKAARVDLLRTEVRLADIEQQFISERNALKVRGYLLASLLGVSGQYESLQIDGELTLMDLPASLDQPFAVALGNRQDYQSLRSRVSAQQTQVDIARGERLPELSFRASYGDRWAMDSSKHNEVGEAGVLFDVPLFEGGRIGARIRRECSRLGAQQQALRKLKLQIRLEVETATSNIEATRARIVATQKAVEQAKESLRIERSTYDLGKGAIIDVLDAQSALLDSQTNYYRALADYNTALAQFRLAVGERQ
jgi:outer membrane protein TolC